jgi:3-deoxy-manno-octulosonate cytidylyltransferase (CMP-KDO synthetase)
MNPVNEKFVAVIPARYASSRLPGKPLEEIAGKPMVLHVCDQAAKSGAEQVLLATDDARIADAAHAHGVQVVMTSPEHPSGTDRIAEVADIMQWPDDRIVINVQGDEPLIPPELIAQVAGLLADNHDADVATLTTAFAPGEDAADAGFAKVVTDCSGYALYFSRAVIPHARDGGQAAGLRRHIGIYGYRVAALSRITAAGICEIESIEKLEQLRCLWLGMRIIVADACAAPPRGIDTPADLAAVRRQIEEGE